MKHRAFTLIEMVVVISVLVIVLSTVATVQILTMTRLGDAAARTAAQLQAQWLLEKIESLSSVAYSCTVYNSGKSAKFILNTNAVDNNSDNIPNSKTPARISREGVEEWGVGARYWVYWGDANGNPIATSSSAQIYIAKRNDDVNPTTADLIPNATIYNGTYRLTLIGDMSFSTTNHALTTSITSTAYGASPTERKSVSSYNQNYTQSFSVQRTTFLAGWHN